jgi:membrane-associated protein
MITKDDSGRFHLSTRTIVAVVGILVLLVAVVLLLQGAGGGDGLGLISAESSSTYLGVALLVLLDAVCPVFPGETTLNAAATLAAQGKLHLWLVILAGAGGAIAGDSALYWASRLCSNRFEKQLDRARQNDKVARGLEFLGTSAPLLLVAGRFVPGVRFVVNASLGTSKYPYSKFLLWSAIGGSVWSVYTCLLAYAVGTALDNYPLASVAISGAITTAGMAAIFWKVRRERRAKANLQTLPSTVD